MTPPTLAQQRGMAFAPMPFAATSFFSSSYVIYYLLCKNREKLQRMYHRLVLAMNFTLLPLSIIHVWRPFAVPEGTPHFPVASGTIQTCTASAFVFMVLSLAVPTYYASLSLQAYMGIKNNFKEEKYKWIEKWVHLVAYCIPCAIAIATAATENFNPNNSGCRVAKAPLGCESDPDTPCERGGDIKYLELTLGLGLIFLYFVFPPSVMISMHCWMGKVQKKMEGSRGMHKIRESARKQMMQSVARQISLYLFSFWFTWVFGLIHRAYQIITRERHYNLLILASCAYASQGFVFAVVYFMLQRLGKPKVDGIHLISPSGPGRKSEVTASSYRSSGLSHELTVGDIRLNAERKAKTSESKSESEMGDDIEESYDFNIFDGAPDEDSPWARFIDPDNEIDAGVTQTNDDDSDRRKCNKYPEQCA